MPTFCPLRKSRRSRLVNIFRMKRRRPPFALVLAAIGVALVALVALTTRHAGSSHHGPPSLAVAGPARECMTAQASGSGVAHATVLAHARVTLPVNVTERVQTPAGTLTATGTEKIVDTAKVERPVSITEHEVVVRRACARGSTPQAAKSKALQHAYADALAASRAKADASARSTVKMLAEQEHESALEDAQALALAKAQASVAAVRMQLGQKLLSELKARTASASKSH
jgi:hypothetical protein